MATLNHHKPIQGVVEVLPTIKDKIEETTNEYNNYLDVLKDEKFEENENEREEDAIKRAESIFDRLDEMRRRNQIVLKNGNETIELIDEVKLKMGNVVGILENDEIQLAKTNNDLVDTIIRLEERKTNKEVEILRNQIAELNRRFNNKRDEWEKHKTNIEDISKKHQQEKKIKRMRNAITINEMNRIESWTENTSVFEKSIK